MFCHLGRPTPVLCTAAFPLPRGGYKMLANNFFLSSMKGTIRRVCTAGLTPFVTPSPARSRACSLHQSCSMQTFVVLMQTPSGFSQAPAQILTFWLLHCRILCMSPKKQRGFSFFFLLLLLLLVLCSFKGFSRHFPLFLWRR